MGFLIELLVFHPMIALLQAGVGVLCPADHPRMKRLQRLAALLALSGVCSVLAGIFWEPLGVSPATGAMAAVLGYVLLVLAGLTGECIERRLWPDESCEAR